jgi:hypothetical protein
MFYYSRQRNGSIGLRLFFIPIILLVSTGLGGGITGLLFDRISLNKISGQTRIVLVCLIYRVHPEE